MVELAKKTDPPKNIFGPVSEGTEIHLNDADDCDDRNVAMNDDGKNNDDCDDTNRTENDDGKNNDDCDDTNGDGKNNDDCDDTNVAKNDDGKNNDDYDYDDTTENDDDGENNGGDDDQPTDHILQEILESIQRSQIRKGSESSLAGSTVSSSHGDNAKISEDFSSIPFGFQPKAAYDHRKENTEIMGVEYNGRMRKFVILDARGIITWNRSFTDSKVRRALTYPKYEYKLITNIIYARKYNCYFALGKDFSLKMLNKDFEETLSVSADLQSVLFMLFNPVTDELITGGVGGTKVWRFHQVSANFKELKAMANFKLTLKSELSDVGGSWVKRVELDLHLQHLYCCSDTGLYAYDLHGNQLFKFKRAHNMSITACKYSPGSRYLITSSLDTEVKVWSLMGGLVQTLRGHSRAVTDVLIHPETSFLFLTSSLDGTVRLWSLETLDVVYCLLVSVDGVLWMGLTDENQLYLSTVHAITIWSLNTFYSFWSLARNKVQNLSLVEAEGKTTRVMAVGEDSSVRLFSRGNQKNLSTVLPPPSLSPLERVLSVTYNRAYSVVYLLMSPTEIWVYTARTDPACRVAVWDIKEIQKFSNKQAFQKKANKTASFFKTATKGSVIERTSVSGTGTDLIVGCCCVCVLNSPVMVWTEEGMCSLLQDSFLLLGLEDGRILFMDPVIKNLKHMEFRASKDKVLEIRHSSFESSLLTLSTLKEYLCADIWTLPQLQLKHEVYLTPDLCQLTLTSSALVTGHWDGSILEHNLAFTEDFGLYSTKAVPSLEDLQRVSRRPDHSGPIVALDCCPQLQIVCSCSGDGMIKIWEPGKVLLSEINMVEPASSNIISSACFLNSCGDLLLAYQNHIFTIHHTKVCPSYTILENSEKDSIDKESAVLEDPRVLYDDRRDDQDVIDLQKYLVPFDIEFSKDFLQGQTKLEDWNSDEGRDEDEESDAGTELSHAPTEIYQSPPPSPFQPSMIDLTLGSEVTQFDLQKQMSKTKKLLFRKGRRKLRRDTLKRNSLTRLDGGDMPQFGVSPGPSPAPSESTISSARSCSSASVSELDNEASDEEKKTTEITEVQVETEPVNHIDPAKDSKVTVEKESAVRPGKWSTVSKPVSPSKPVSTSKSKYTGPQIKLRDADRSIVTRKVIPKVSSDEVLPTNHSHVRRIEPPPKSTSKQKKELKKKSPVVNRVAGKGRTKSPQSADKTATDAGQDHTSETEDLSARGITPDAASEKLGFPKPHQTDDKDESDDDDDYDETIVSARDVDNQRDTADVNDDVSILSEGIPKLWLKEEEDSILGERNEDWMREDRLRRPDDLTSPTQGQGRWASPQNLPGGIHQMLSGVSTEGSGREGSPLLSIQERNILRQRPASSYTAITHISAKIKRQQELPPRPHTAVEGLEDTQHYLETLFDSALRQYQSRSGSPESKLLLYQNPGKEFEENWQDRIIERHQLIKLQRQLRAQSASHKRRLLAERQHQKRHSLRGHHNCDPTNAGEIRPDSSLAVLHKLEQANKVHWMKNKQQQQHRPNRGYTAVPSQNNDRQNLSSELPFRLRANRSLTDTRRRVPCEDVDIRNLDPRNPKAKRPHSSKSIPSKCSHYILVERPAGEEGVSVASPLEEQLIAERFPKYFYPYNQQDLDRTDSHISRDKNISFVQFVRQLAACQSCNN